MIKIPIVMTKYALLVSLFFLGNWCQNTTQDIQNRQEAIATTFYFIRHAEKETVNKGNRNPDLSELGLRRAETWAQIFKFTDFDAIYSTNYKRTMNTAKPIAESKNLKIARLNYPEIPYEFLLSNHAGKKVLFVGHSNTTPEMVNHFLGKEEYSQMNENDFGSLFIATIFEDNGSVNRLNLE